MLKDTKSLGNNKAPACESRGFVLKKEGVLFDTPSFSFITIPSVLSYKNSQKKKVMESIQTIFNIKSIKFLFRAYTHITTFYPTSNP